jgi:hypothetical protein
LMCLGSSMFSTFDEDNTRAFAVQALLSRLYSYQSEFRRRSRSASGSRSAGDLMFMPPRRTR